MVTWPLSPAHSRTPGAGLLDPGQPLLPPVADTPDPAPTPDPVAPVAQPEADYDYGWTRRFLRARPR